MSKVFFGDWDLDAKPHWNKDLTGLDRMRADFTSDPSSWRNGDGGPVPDDINVLFAIYHDPWGYSGEASGNVRQRPSSERT